MFLPFFKTSLIFGLQAALECLCDPIDEQDCALGGIGIEL